MKKPSKTIHLLHLAGMTVIVGTYIYTLITLQIPLFALYTLVIANLFHPKWKCVLTHHENKRRAKEGLPPIKWFAHYILSGRPFRKD